MLKPERRQAQPKRRTAEHSYFNKKWSRETGFAKNVDRTDYTFEEGSGYTIEAELSRDVLMRYEHKATPEVCNIVRRLRDTSISFVAKHRGVQLEQMQRAAMFNEAGVALTNRMFLFLCQCAVELNASLAFNDLKINASHPEHVREVLRYNLARQPVETITYYRARLSSPSWGLVIRSREDRIELFVLPVGKMLGLSRSENEYKSVTALQGVIEKELVTWELDGKPLTEDREKELCVLLFKQMLDRALAELVEVSPAAAEEDTANDLPDSA